MKNQSVNAPASVFLLIFTLFICSTVNCTAQKPFSHTNGGIVVDTPVIMENCHQNPDRHVKMGTISVKKVDNDTIKQKHDIIYFVVDFNVRLDRGDTVCFEPVAIPPSNKGLIALDVKKSVRGHCPGHGPR